MGRIPSLATKILFRSLQAQLFKYATALAWPADNAVIKSLRAGSELQTGRIVDVTLLGVGQLDWVQDETGLRIKLPVQPPHEYAFSFKILFS